MLCRNRYTGRSDIPGVSWSLQGVKIQVLYLWGASVILFLLIRVTGAFTACLWGWLWGCLWGTAGLPIPQLGGCELSSDGHMVPSKNQL